MVDRIKVYLFRTALLLSHNEYTQKQSELLIPNSPGSLPPPQQKKYSLTRSPSASDGIGQKRNGTIKRKQTSNIRSARTNRNAIMSKDNSIKCIRGRQDRTTPHTKEYITSLCAINQHNIRPDPCRKGRPSLNNELRIRITARVKSKCTGQARRGRVTVNAWAKGEAAQGNAGKVGRRG